jgi:transposase InsO family protein
MLESFLSRQKEKALHYSIEKACHIFGVSRSGYYSWQQRREKRAQIQAAEELEERELMEKFRAIVKKLCYVPGKRTFRTFLWRDYGISISVKRCRRIMNKMNLAANKPKRDAYKNRATHDHETTAPKDLVGQDFKVGPRQIILTDITYLYYGSDRDLFYLCAFKDAFTTEVLGHSISRDMGTPLVRKAYERMMREHGSELHEPGVLIHHDQGSQYLSTSFQQLLADDGFLQSCSRRGNSRDNAPMESFFGRMKCCTMDLVALCRTYEAAEKLVENYLQEYNHSHYRYDIAGLTPAEYYVYVTTGIYPCDDYYGVKPEEMMTVGDLVSKRMEIAAAKEAKRRERIRRSKEQQKQNMMSCPPQVRVNRDAALVQRLANQYRGVQKEALAWIEKNQRDHRIAGFLATEMDQLLVEIQQAQDFLNKLSTDQLQQLQDPQVWSRYPQLDYRLRMRGLYDCNPLKHYQDENEVLITSGPVSELTA